MQRVSQLTTEGRESQAVSACKSQSVSQNRHVSIRVNEQPVKLSDARLKIPQRNAAADVRCRAVYG